MISLTRLSQAGLFVAFFFALWGQTGVTTVAWSSAVGEATHLTDAVATVAGARALTGQRTQAALTSTLDLRKPGGFLGWGRKLQRLEPKTF